MSKFTLNQAMLLVYMWLLGAIMLRGPKQICFQNVAIDLDGAALAAVPKL